MSTYVCNTIHSFIAIIFSLTISYDDACAAYFTYYKMNGMIEGGIVMVLRAWRLTQAEAYINIKCLLFTHILSLTFPCV